MECTLHRRKGSPIAARTVDLGRARVLRQQGYDSYAVRFEALGEPARAEVDGIVALRT
jgi:hypothetical protein